MKKYFIAIFAILFSLTCSSCATQLNTSNQNLEQLQQNEGIIFGSVIVKNDLTNEKKSWGGLLGGLTKIDSNEVDYRLFIHKRNFLEEPNFNLDLGINSEKQFIYKFNDGEYCIKHINPITKGSFAFQTMLKIPVDLCFVVQPRTNIYIGKLTISIPKYIQTGSGLSINIEDQKNQCISDIEKDSKIELGNSQTNLLYDRRKNN